MKLGVAKETVAGENRVAIVPDLVPKATKAGLEVRIEPGAGEAAGFSDRDYAAAGANVGGEVFESADVLLKVQPPTTEDAGRIREGVILIALLQAYSNQAGLPALADRRVITFAMELMPRITRAQPMDALSAMSTVSGYKAVLMAAARLPKFFPLLMTAAGTVQPAHVLIIGAGVAGL